MKKKNNIRTISKKDIDKYGLDFSGRFKIICTKIDDEGNTSHHLISPAEYYIQANEFFPELMIYLNEACGREYYTKKEQMEFFSDLNIRIGDILVTDGGMVNQIFDRYEIPYYICNVTEKREGKRSRKGIGVAREPARMMEKIPMPGDDPRDYYEEYPEE